MFQTDLIHFLQSFDSTLLRGFMSFISLLGTTPIILLIILGITFAIDFKRGLILINVIAWTSILTIVLKEQINYPRPIDVDTKITDNYYDRENIQDLNTTPNTFFGIFSKELLEITRNDQYERYGFPSGHTAIQTALWFSLFFLFRKSWIKKLGIVIVALTILSRLFLGHHFLADTIGGLILGLTVAYGMMVLIKRSGYITALSHQLNSLTILWLPIILIPFSNHLPIWVLSSLIGVNLASTIIILQKNFPVFHVITWKRVLAGAISLIVLSSSIYWIKNNSFSGNDFANLSISSILIFIIVIGATFLNNRLNLIRFRF